jgi:two-component system chemotaxis response regulator CheY
MHALVIDDSRAIRLILGRMLKDLGFDVHEAANGREGLALLDAGLTPELVLLDWNMPVMTGIEFLRKLRDEPGGDAPVVVFCTVENDIAHIREALDAGANEYIMKPFDGDIIADKLAEAGL